MGVLGVGDVVRNSAETTMTLCQEINFLAQRIITAIAVKQKLDLFKKSIVEVAVVRTAEKDGNSRMAKATPEETQAYVNKQLGITPDPPSSVPVMSTTPGSATGPQSTRRKSRKTRKSRCYRKSRKSRKSKRSRKSRGRR